MVLDLWVFIVKYVCIDPRKNPSNHLQGITRLPVRYIALNNLLPNNLPVQVGKHCLLFSGLGVLLRRLPNNPLTADIEISFEYLPWSESLSANSRRFCFCHHYYVTWDCPLANTGHSKYVHRGSSCRCLIITSD